MGPRSLFLTSFPGDFYDQKDWKRSGLGNLLRSLQLHNRERTRAVCEKQPYTLWLEACLPLLLQPSLPSMLLCRASCVIGCHCLFRKWQGGALISRSTAQPPSWAKMIPVSSPSYWPWQSQPQLQVWGRRTSGSRAGRAPPAALEILPYRPLWTFCFPISALMLEKLVGCRVVLVRLLGLWVLLQFGIS